MKEGRLITKGKVYPEYRPSEEEVEAAWTDGDSLARVLCRLGARRFLERRGGTVEEGYDGPDLICGKWRVSVKSGRKSDERKCFGWIVRPDRDLHLFSPDAGGEWLFLATWHPEAAEGFPSCVLLRHKLSLPLRPSQLEPLGGDPDIQLIYSEDLDAHTLLRH